jgi:hypothetical protein
MDKVYFSLLIILGISIISLNLIYIQDIITTVMRSKR